MAMNLFILFFISFPEAILGLYMILLFAGEKKYLYLLNRKNVLRFAATLALMLTASYTLRPLAPNVAVNTLLHCVAYIIIIGIVYRMDIYRTVFAVVLLLSFFATVENGYIPFVITYISKGIREFYSNKLVLLLVSIPTRILQLATIMFLRKYYIVFIATKLNKRIYTWLTAIMLFVFCIDYSASYMFVLYFNSLSFVHQIFSSIGLYALGIINFLILKLVYENTKWTVGSATTQYQNLERNSEHIQEEVYRLLQNNDINGAKRLLEKAKNRGIKG
ncbi:MAG: hypothetical protein N3B21_18460 [Clostridia bacterium]|nr:hypothetical protein [Clostridia bacterium]